MAPALADLLGPVYAVDVFLCNECGGRRRILAAITDPEVAHKIVHTSDCPPACHGLPHRSPVSPWTPTTPASIPSPQNPEPHPSANRERDGKLIETVERRAPAVGHSGDCYAPRMNSVRRGRSGLWAFATLGFVALGCTGGAGADLGAGVDDMAVEPPPLCADGRKDGHETDVDCGGLCLACDNGRACVADRDCVHRTCRGGRCADACADHTLDGNESDVDCGGSCPPCAAGAACRAAADCSSGTCFEGVCLAPPCSDASVDGQCTDWRCYDWAVDGDETDHDCGGGTCPACPSGYDCLVNRDCKSGVCGDNHRCLGPLCADGVRDGDETDVDCGATCFRWCADGKRCTGDVDCDSFICVRGVCAPATCRDGRKDADETDVDCGGPACARCLDGSACNGAGDCCGGGCSGGACGCVEADADGGVPDMGAPTGTYVVVGHPFGNRSTIDILKKDTATGTCMRMLVQYAACPDPDHVRAPCGWGVFVVERYAPNWDCSAAFHAGIPDRGTNTNMTGRLSYTVANGQFLPCKVSLAAEVEFSAAPAGKFRFDVDDATVIGGCQ